MSIQQSSQPQHPHSSPRLTDFAIAAAKAPATGRITLWDAGQPHFGVRITSQGSKSYVVILGRKRLTIGKVGIITLAQARAKAKHILAERTLGRHLPAPITWEKATAEFLAETKEKNRPATYEGYTRFLNGLSFQSRLTEIAPEDVRRQLERIKSKSTRYHVLGVAKVFFNWTIKNGYLDRSPTRTSSAQKSVPRSRVLSDEELAKIWRACQHVVQGKDSPTREEREDGRRSFAMPASYCRLVQLLILSGLRRGEASQIQLSWISSSKHSFLEHSSVRGHGISSPATADLWTLQIPGTISKNGKEHIVPISTLTLQLLKTATSGNSLTPLRITHWSRHKKALDELSGVYDWTHHDLRRTFATRLAALSVPPHLIERLLNHVSGVISGVSATYNRHHFMPEMREALDLYEQHLKRVLALP